MKLIDRIYLNLYWCGNLGRGGGLIDMTLERILILPLMGILMIFFAITTKIFRIHIGVGWLVIVSVILSWILSYRFFAKYLTDEKRKEILKTYRKPSRLRYLVLIGVTFGGIGLLIFSAIITRKILVSNL